MVHLAMEAQSQYMTQSSNDIQNTSHNTAHSDATTALVRYPPKEADVSSLHRDMSVTTELNTTQKGKEKQRPKPVYEVKKDRARKSSSSQAHLEKVEDGGYDKELDEIEKDLNGIWDEDGM